MNNNIVKPLSSVQQMLLRNKQAPSHNCYMEQFRPRARNTSQYTMQATSTLPGPAPPIKDVSPLISVQQKAEKNIYVIGDTKEEMIENIISNKASVTNVRKALSKYAELVMEEDLF